MAKKPTQNQSQSSLMALQLAWELGFTIALPLVIFVLVGRYLDKYFQTTPILMLVGIFLAFFISSYAIFTKTAQIYKDLEAYDEKPNENDKKKTITK